jgi:type II secretion system protein C
MLKNYFWVIVLVYLTLFAFITADLLGSVVKSKISSKDISSVTLAAPKSIEETRSVNVRKWDRESVLRIKNIFNPQTTLTDTEIETSEEGLGFEEENLGDLAPSTLAYQVKGITYGPPEFSSVILAQGNKQKAYWIDDKVESAVVVKIERNRVIFNNNGKLEYLTMKKEEQAKTSSSRTAPIQKNTKKLNRKEDFSGATTQQAVISKQEKDDAMSNPGKIMTQIRVVPNLQQGKMDGFKVLNILKKSIFDKVVLKNGDIIKRINGVVMENPEKALALFEQFKDDSSFSIDLTRKGEKLHFDVEVR